MKLRGTAAIAPLTISYTRTLWAAFAKSWSTTVTTARRKSVSTYPKAQAILQASWNWPFGRKDMEVYGQSGYVLTVGRDGVRTRRPKEDKEEAQITAPPLPAPYDDSLSYLRAVVLDELKPEGLSSLETNMIVVEILDAARRSAVEGKTVRILH